MSVLFQNPTYVLQCFGESNFWSELPEGWTWHLEEACRSVSCDMGVVPYTKNAKRQKRAKSLNMYIQDERRH